MRHLLKRVQVLNVGDLKGVEQEVLISVFALGRKALERIIQAQPGDRRGAGAARRSLWAYAALGQPAPKTDVDAVGENHDPPRL